MSIKTAAYQACKVLARAPRRAELRQLLVDLNVVRDNSLDQTDRSQLGYYARNERRQFLGYLIVDQERNRLKSGPFPVVVPSLYEAERALVADAHAEVAELNRCCTSTLVDRFPNARLAVDPYSDYLDPVPALSSCDSSRFLTPETVDTVAEAFRTHPAVEVLLGLPAGTITRIPDQELAGAVHALEGAIRQAGVGHVPSQLEQLAFRTPIQHPQRIVVRIAAALLDIRASLRALDQMLYQAVQVDKPPTLCEDNLIAIANAQSNIVGSTAALTYQPDRHTFMLAPGDVVLVREVPNAVPLYGLAQIESASFEHSREYGSTNRIAVRMLNDALSPYGNLPAIL